MRVILLGPPGSGKGTQGELIEKRYGFPRISTGDLLRQAVQEKTSLGGRADAQMKQGKLVSDDIVEELVRQKIFSPDCRRGYVLDGFPRNLVQARSLESMDGGQPEIVIELEISARALIQRLKARRICGQCGAIHNLEVHKPKKEGVCDLCGGSFIQRNDDKPEVISERLRVYADEREKLRDYYRQKKVLHEVDGTGDVEAVFCRISSLLDAQIAKSRESKARR